MRNKRRVKAGLVFIVLCMTALLGTAQTQYKTWRFINIPDYHNAEGFAKNTPERESRIKEQTEGFKQMKERYGGELIVMPGDCNGGHWYSQKFLKPFKAYPEYKDYNTEEVILEASRLCYNGLWEIITKGGYENFLIAPGDHELGDNPWRKGSEVVKHIGTFRQGFANTFTLDKNGKSRYTEKIGNALPRPVGTKYEHTSNAVQYKNVLFITLDMFRFDAADKNLGSEGVVNGDISGKHLEWFESVLAEAQNIPKIKHVVVQSHLPIIYPVRKTGSSGMLVDKNESEKILNVLRKYKVDLYLAGEVHMTTVTKDSKSDLIQLVGRGNNLSNMTLVDVSNNKLTLCYYHENGNKLGDLVIDKTLKKTRIVGSGLLTPINPKGIQIHWSFNEQQNKSNYINKTLGEFPKSMKYSPLLASIEDPLVYDNDGGFYSDYALIGSKVKEAKGILGNAAEITESSNLMVLPMGPMMEDYERTLACWIKTEAKGRRLILNSGSYWGKGQFFNLSINDGNSELAISPEIYKSTTNQSINDGEWHHMAVVVPYKNSTIEDVKLYIDGELIKDAKTTKPQTRINTSQANWMSVSTQIETYRTDLRATMNMKNYVGLLDDFSIWTRALTDKDIKRIYAKGLKGIDALSVENE